MPFLQISPPRRPYASTTVCDREGTQNYGLEDSAAVAQTTAAHDAEDSARRGDCERTASAHKNSSSSSRPADNARNEILKQRTRLVQKMVALRSVIQHKKTGNESDRREGGGKLRLRLHELAKRAASRRRLGDASENSQRSSNSSIEDSTDDCSDRDGPRRSHDCNDNDENSISLVFDNIPSQQEMATASEEMVVLPSNTTISLGTGSISAADGEAFPELDRDYSSLSVPPTDASAGTPSYVPNDNDNDYYHSGSGSGKDSLQSHHSSAPAVVNFHAATPVKSMHGNTDDRHSRYKPRQQTLRPERIEKTYFMRVADLAVPRQHCWQSQEQHHQCNHHHRSYFLSSPPGLTSSSLSCDDSENIDEGIVAPVDDEDRHASPSSSKHTVSDNDDDDDISAPREYYHYASGTPPTPTISASDNEYWIAINMLTVDQPSVAVLSPMARIAMPRLVDYALKLAYDQQRWIPESKTKSILNKSRPSWHSTTFRRTPQSPLSDDRTLGTSDSSDVLIWSTGANFHSNIPSTHQQHQHEMHYGHEIPAVRSAAIIPMKPADLHQLLWDSSRIREYNKFSLGRTDLLTFTSDGDEDDADHSGDSSTKITHATTKPPIVRKPIDMINLMHSQRLDNGDYIIVSKSDAATATDTENLLTVHLIRQLSSSDVSMLINVTHIKPSSMVPSMVARRVGLLAAANFMHDIQSLC